MATVLCSGSIVYDILVQPVEEQGWGTTTLVECLEYHVGGNGANTSRALAAMGVDVRLLGTVGCDDQARFVVDELRRAGVETGGVRTVNAPTATTVVLVNRAGDRKFVHRAGSSGLAFPEPIEFTPELTGGAAHYHMASLFLLPRMRPHASETLARARAAGLTTSMDTNWDPQGRWMEDLAPCLPLLDVLFVNEDEARMITGSANPAVAGEVLLRQGVAVAVIKLGRRGCAIYTCGGETVCPAFDVQPHDTTGAGDCFVAGFLAARLRGASLREAGCFANAVGALTVQRIGAVPHLPAYAEVQDWMKSAHLRLDGVQSALQE